MSDRAFLHRRGLQRGVPDRGILHLGGTFSTQPRLRSLGAALKAALLLLVSLQTLGWLSRAEAAPHSSSSRSALTRQGAAKSAAHPARAIAAPALPAHLDLYEPLRVRYFRLRNTDEQVSDPAEWAAVAGDIEAFIVEHPKDPAVPQALLNLANLYEQLFGRTHREQDLLRSLAALSRLVRGFPADSRADDALLQAGIMTEDRFNDKAGAVRIYNRLLAKYPGSDSATAARLRLKNLTDGQGLKGWSSARAPGALQRPGASWVVVIDPGHGGEDYGAQGPGGILEKDVTLMLALEVERLLEQDSQIDVELTRRSDVFVPLAERTRLANNWGADLFVSVHNNASGHGQYAGMQTFYLDAAGDDASRLLAERENGKDALRGEQGDLTLMLSDLTQSAKQRPSISLAHDVHSSVMQQIKSRGVKTKDRGVRPGPFYVLVGAHMPCALIELLFIDNPEDSKNLASREFRSALARGMSQGLKRYLTRGIKVH